MRTETEVTLQC